MYIVYFQYLLPFWSMYINREAKVSPLKAPTVLKVLAVT